MILQSFPGKVESGKIKIQEKGKLEMFLSLLEGKDIVVKIGKFQKTTEKQRTAKQNNALHLYFQLIADALNNSGQDMRAILKDVEIPWTPENVKDYLWRPIQKLQLGKESTTELKTEDIDKIFETLNRHLATFGIHEPFPSIETLANRLGAIQ